MTDVTCRLTAKDRDQLRNPTLGNRVQASFDLSYKIILARLFCAPYPAAPGATASSSPSVRISRCVCVRVSARSQIFVDCARNKAPARTRYGAANRDEEVSNRNPRQPKVSFTARRYASAIFAVVVCLSVRLCLSVTNRYCVEATEVIELFCRGRLLPSIVH